MIGKGGRDVKPELSPLCRRHPCRRFTIQHEISHPEPTGHSMNSVAHIAGRQVSRRCHFDRDTIIDGLANLLAHSTSDTTLMSHHEIERVKIHRERLNGAFRHTGMTALACGADAMRHRRQPHTHVEIINNRQERLRRTGGDTGQIVA